MSSLPIKARYDEEGDVLYVSAGRAVPASVSRRARGVLLRYSDADDAPCGVTVVGLRAAGWDHELDALAQLIASHVGVAPAEVNTALNQISLVH